MGHITDDIEQLGRLYPGAVALYEARDGELHLLYFSDALPALFGLTREEYAARDAAQGTVGLIVEQDRPYVARCMASAVSGEDGPSGSACSYRVKLGGGNYRWMNVRGRRIAEHDGNPVVVAEFLDTTVEARMHEELLEHTSNGVYVCDAHSMELLYANAKAIDTWRSARTASRGADEGASRDYLGAKCYTFIRGRSTPCPWCALNTMQGDSLCTESSLDPDLNAYFRLDCQRLAWYGRPALYVSFEDVTEEHETRASLAEAKDELATLVDRIPSGVGIIDVANLSKVTLAYQNDGYYNMIGSTREQRRPFLGDRILDAVYPADVEGVVREMHEAINHQRLYQHSFRLLYGDGSYRWTNLIATHETRHDGSERFYASFYDVDEEMRERRNLQHLISNIPAAIVVYRKFDGEISVLRANDQAADLLGAPRPYAQKGDNGGGIMPHVHPEDAEPLHQCFERLFSDEHESELLLRNRRRADGPYVWFHLRGRSFAQPDGSELAYVVFTDATASVERRQAEDKLLDIIAHLPVISALYTLGPGGAALPKTFSDGFCELLGVDQEEAYSRFGRDGFAHVHPDDVVGLRAFAAVRPDGDAPASITHRVVRADGHVLWVNATISWFDQEGVEYAYVVYTDITAIKTEEEMARRSFREADAYLESVSDDYLVTMRIDLTDDRIESIQGTNPITTGDKDLSYDSLLATRLRAVLPRPEDRLAFERTLSRQVLTEAFESGRRNVTLDFRYLPEPGSRPIWARETSSLMRNPETGHVVSFSTIESIDDEVVSQQIVERLMSSDECDFIAIIDTRRRTIDFKFIAENLATPMASRNMPYDECARHNAENYVVESDRPSSLLATSIETIERRLGDESTYSYALNLRGIDGTLRHKLLRYSYLDRHDGLVLAVRTDVTETFAKEQADRERLQKALSEAEQANLAKTSFLSRMSHDIRTPMNGIIGMTGLALDEEVTPQVRDYLEKIDASGKFLLSLVNDILDISKAESGKLELHSEHYSYAEFREYVVSLFEPLCAEKGITFTMIDPPEPHTIIQDKLRLNQVFFNLLSNAVKFTPRGGRVTFVVASMPPTGRQVTTLFTVRDTGIGMSPEFLQHLFEPFSQEYTQINTTRRGSGTGLGLSIVKDIIDLMGGTIQVKSTPGHGTSFRVTITSELVPDIEMPPSPEETSPITLAGKHFLVAEDNAINAEIEMRILEKQGASVTVAANGERALRQFAASDQYQFDGVLMDVRMPVMDGLEATRRIRALNRPDAKTVPIIAVTADAFVADVERCHEAGMDGHVAKPVTPESIVIALGEAAAR